MSRLGAFQAEAVTPYRPEFRYIHLADANLREFPDGHFGAGICTFALYALGRAARLRPFLSVTGRR